MCTGAPGRQWAGLVSILLQNHLWLLRNPLRNQSGLHFPSGKNEGMGTDDRSTVVRRSPRFGSQILPLSLFPQPLGTCAICTSIETAREGDSLTDEAVMATSLFKLLCSGCPLGGIYMGLTKHQRLLPFLYVDHIISLWIILAPIFQSCKITKSLIS